MHEFSILLGVVGMYIFVYTLLRLTLLLISTALEARIPGVDWCKWVALGATLLYVRFLCL